MHNKKNDAQAADGANTEDLAKLLEDIAREKLRIPTLKQRRSDSLDFHDCAVWCVYDALKAAYQAGVASAKKS